MRDHFHPLGAAIQRQPDALLRSSVVSGRILRVSIKQITTDNRSHLETKAVKEMRPPPRFKQTFVACQIPECKSYNLDQSRQREFMFHPNSNFWCDPSKNAIGQYSISIHFRSCFDYIDRDYFINWKCALNCSYIFEKKNIKMSVYSTKNIFLFLKHILVFLISHLINVTAVKYFGTHT